MKKLFVSDLDGTLLKIGNEYSAGVSKENKEIIQKYTSSGSIFAIASARAENYLSVMEQMLGFTPDYIGGNGTAVVCDGQIERSYLDSEFYSQLKQAMRNHRLYASVILHTEQASYLEKRDAYPFGFENPLHTPAVLVKGHGPFTFGKDGANSVYNAVVLEEVAKMAMIMLSVNQASNELPAHIQDKHFYRKHGPNAYYGQGGAEK